MGAQFHLPTSPEVALFSHQVQVKSFLSIYFVPKHVTCRDYHRAQDGTTPQLGGASDLIEKAGPITKPQSAWDFKAQSAVPTQT